MSGFEPKAVSHSFLATDQCSLVQADRLCSTDWVIEKYLFCVERLCLPSLLLSCQLFSDFAQTRFENKFRAVNTLSPIVGITSVARLRAIS